MSLPVILSLSLSHTFSTCKIRHRFFKNNFSNSKLKWVHREYEKHNKQKKRTKIFFLVTRKKLLCKKRKTGISNDLLRHGHTHTHNKQKIIIITSRRQKQTLYFSSALFIYLNKHHFEPVKLNYYEWVREGGGEMKIFFLLNELFN